MKKIIFCVIVLLITSVLCDAQQLYIPRNIQKAYDKGTRSADGKPGKNYWQNYSEYYIRVKFNPQSRLVEGEQIITYYNNSPDTLKKIVFKVYPDNYKKGVKRNVEIAPEDVSDGVAFSKIIIGERDYLNLDKKDLYREGTNLIVKTNPISPQGKTTCQINWSYILNKGSHNRTGQIDDGSYFLGYFFPRIAVYDDIEGWDENEYFGRQEPYFEHSSFNVFVTVPKNYMVWATGELQNPAEVLHENVLKKWTNALLSDKPVFVIDSTDLKNKTVTLKNKYNTFQFKASAPDFVFATANHYVWQGCNRIVDSTTLRKSFVTTAFNPEHKNYFEIIDFATKTMDVMCFDFPGVPYPYPHLTIIDGLDQMEYPMMINDNPIDDRAEAIELTDHEMMHQYFPFFMGNNQTKYGWMDEGWATLGEWYISPKIDSTIIDLYGMPDINYFMGREWDSPLITNTTEIYRGLFLNQYVKPALSYLYLWDMLGDVEFKKALHYYMSQWNGKHPTPWDFFNCINTGSGKNFDWFWKAWYYEWGYADLGIKSVSITSDGHNVIIEAKGNKPVPVTLFVNYTDSTFEKIHRTAEVWKNGNKEVVLEIKTDKKIKDLKLGDTYDADVNKKDNTYKPEN